MSEVIVAAPTSSERLESELKTVPSGRRRLPLIATVCQRAPLRWWFAKHSTRRSEAELSKVPVYPGA